MRAVDDGVRVHLERIAGSADTPIRSRCAALPRLNDVRELVNEEPTALGAFGGEASAREEDVFTDRERFGADRASRGCRDVVRVNAHARELDTEHSLERLAERTWKRRTGAERACRAVDLGGLRVDLSAIDGVPQDRVRAAIRGGAQGSRGGCSLTTEHDGVKIVREQ